MSNALLQAYARAVLPSDSVQRGNDAVVWQTELDCFGNVVTVCESGPIRFCAGTKQEVFEFLKYVRMSNSHIPTE